MATSNAVLKGIKSAWIDLLKTGGFQGTDAFTTVLQSQSNTEDYYIAKTNPIIKNLVDEVNFGEIGDFKLSVDNKTYYNAVREDRYRIEDSKEYLTNSIELQLRNISRELADFESKLVSDALLSGSTEAVSQLSLEQYNAFDGKAFFSTTRNIPGSTATNNKYTQTGITLATFEADYDGARNQLINLKDGNGRPYNQNPKLIVFVPPAMEIVAKQLLSPTQNLISSTGSLKNNVYAGDAEVVVNWAVAGTTQYRWYLINTAKKDLALVQNRMDAEWYMEDDQKKPWVGYYYKLRKGVSLLNPMSAVRVST